MNFKNLSFGLSDLNRVSDEIKMSKIKWKPAFADGVCEWYQSKSLNLSFWFKFNFDLHYHWVDYQFGSLSTCTMHRHWKNQNFKFDFHKLIGNMYRSFFNKKNTRFLGTKKIRCLLAHSFWKT